MQKEINILKKNARRNKKSLLEAQRNYILAKAIHETNLKIDEESKREALEENVFYAYEPQLRGREVWGLRITDPQEDYNLNDTDFIEYLKIVDRKRRDKGLKLPYHKYDWAIKEPYNLSSDCESREILREAEKCLINIGVDILPEPLKSELERFKSEYHWKHTPKLVNTIMSFKVD